MFKEFPEDDAKTDDFLNEFRQKISDQNINGFEEKKEELKRSKNIFLGIAGGVILAGIVGWLILAPQYRVENEKEIPVIRRPQTAIRVQPNEPGGMNIPNQDRSVYNILDKKEDNGVENLLPPPEEPKLPVIEQTPEVSQPEVTEPLKNTIEEPASPLPEAQKIIEKEEAKANISAEQVIQKAQEPVKEVMEKKEESTKPAQPTEVKKSEPQKTEEKPVVKAVEKKAETKTSPAVSGDWQIQLMSSPNKAAVEKAKGEVAQKYKISHLPFEIEPAVLDANKTFYRLKVGAFKARAEADKLCNDIKALGGTCIVKKK